MADKNEIISEMNSLIRNYRITCDSTSGCGSRGQGYIDSALEKIDRLIEKHPEIPELKQMRPRRYICQNDGMGGMSGFGRAFYNR
jgi:hypothetical protein